MRLLQRFALLVLLVMSQHAITQEVVYEGYPADWQGERLYPLIFATADLGKEERAARFVEWMENNDWRAVNLELNDVYNLFDKIKVDAVDITNFSARWSGSVTAPDSGEYTFSQVRDFSDRDSKIKLTIGSRVVLDSASSDVGEARFTSSPVALNAGEPTPIVVELVHEVEPPLSKYSGGAPMAFLTWKSGQAPESIIPSSAFTPPEGFGPTGTTGLQGEYYRSTDFTGLVQTRLDASLDQIWSMPPVASVHQDLSKECIDRCIATILNGEFLAQTDPTVKDNTLDFYLRRIAYHMTATERQQLVEVLLSRPEVVEMMTKRGMARLWQSIYMLPSGDQVRLLGEWTLSQPQPRTQAGPYPGWSDGSYQQVNTDYYWLLGLFMQGPYWEHAERLWDEYLVLPNGECNLRVAYMTAYATREESFLRDAHHLWRYYEQIDQRLDDDSVAGDMRVTWLLARVFIEEIISAEHPRLNPDSEYLVESRLVASSPDYQFWALQETAARFASQGRVDDLQELLEGVTGDTQVQREAIASWRDVGDAQVIAASELKEQEQARSASAMIDEFERRLLMAQERGDSDAIAKYSQLIESKRSSGNEPSD